MNIEEIRQIISSRLSDPVILKTGATISKKQYLEEFISEDMLNRAQGNIDILLENTIQQNSTVSKNGNTITITSPYLSIDISSIKNQKCGDLLITLALDDANKKQDFIQEYLNILSSCRTKEETESLLSFLNLISSVGEKGKEYKSLLEPITSSYSTQMTTTNVVEQQAIQETVKESPNQLDEIQKRIELLRMDLEGELSKKVVDTDYLRIIANKMNKEVSNLDYLFENNRSRDALMLRDKLEVEIMGVRSKADAIEDMSRQMSI